MTTIKTEDIWDTFSHDLRRFVKSRLKNDDIVDDTVQEIFFKIHTNIGNLKDVSNLRGWVFQIARNAVIDYFRKEKKAATLVAALEQEESFDTDAKIDEILYFCMDHFVGQLPEKYKQAIIYTEYEKNSQVKLAQKENISVSAAKSRVQRARQKLKRLILEYAEFECQKSEVKLDELIDAAACCDG